MKYYDLLGWLQTYNRQKPEDVGLADFVRDIFWEECGKSKYPDLKVSLEYIKPGTQDELIWYFRCTSHNESTVTYVCVRELALEPNAQPDQKDPTKRQYRPFPIL